jgi:ADP-ribose pyrophosphatase YjhB (NUDIX family)
MDIKKYKSQDRILLAVDCIIFGFNGTEMKALLIKRGFEPEKGKWSLMGGFVGEKEPVNDAAARVLKQLTGLTNIYMEQLQCFGDTHRDTAGRVVSVAYFALINIENYNEQLTHDHEARWFAMSKIPPLIFDHKLMLKKAKKILAEKVSNHPIGFELLPIKFTLRQLQNLYEAIFEAPLDKRNFTRKILSINVLKKLKEKERESSRKGAFYYRFDRATYEKLQNDKIEFI